MSELPSDLEQLSREALIRLVLLQARHIQALEARIAALEAENERLKREGKRQAAPFSKGERKADPKRPGRKPGEGPFRYRTRPGPSEITEPPVDVPLRQTACPGCGGALEDVRVDLAWRTELPLLPRPEVREYRIAVACCRRCGKQVRGEHPEVAPDQRGATAHRLGPRLLAAAHVLHYGVGVPLRKVPAVLRELWGARLTQGALTQAALRETEREAGVAYDDLRGELPGARAVYTDPTGWRVGGERAQLAVYDTDSAVVYEILRHYTNEAVREVIGDAYPGVLITDRGRVFDARSLAGVKQQKCLSHVLRSLSEVAETKNGRARDFPLRLAALLREALHLSREWRAGRLAEAAYRSEAERICSDVTHHLRVRRLRDPDNQRLLNELGWHHNRGNLVRFLEEPAVEPTNNRAERALRPAVISRKVSQCSKTWGGAEAYAIFVSLLRTAIKREARSAVDALVQVLETGRPPPLPNPA